MLCALANHPGGSGSQELVASMLADLAEGAEEQVQVRATGVDGGAVISRKVQIARGGGMHALMALYAACDQHAGPGDLAVVQAAPTRDTCS